MRCYLVTATDPDRDNAVVAKRLAGTNALARETRDQLMESKGLRKKDITIEDHEVPVDKTGLLEHLNGLYEEMDLGETEGDE